MAPAFFQKGKEQFISIAVGLLKSARPRQWLKNFAVFAALIFSGQLFIPETFFLAIITFLIFCALSSAMYLVNDVIDIPRDLLHPFKSKRPIAQGIVPAKLALTTALILTIGALFTSSLLGPFLAFMAITFVILQLLYTFWLKNIILLDVMTIAATFILRVLAGAIAINTKVTVWFLLTVSSLALFLAVGKRRSERTILAGELAAKHRGTLLHYPDTLLDSLTIMFATASWFAYTMFTFLEPIPRVSPTVLILFGELLPRAFIASKLLMISVPLVIYGVMRYLFIIYERKEGESPEVVLLSDKPLLATVILWVLVVIGVIYGQFLLESFTNFRV